jgi:4-hydroxy-tetrahydrodipicolinate synthase
MLHDIPSRTNRELSDDTLARLAESKQFIGLRDGTADIARPPRLRPLLPARFRLLSGDDATALAFIANGGDGCISLISNVAPELCRVIFANCRQGRLQSARYLQNRLARLTASLTKESPAALKYALCLLGYMSPKTRLPIVELADAAKAEVARAIAAIGDEDIACPSESWHGGRLHKDTVATS